MLLENVIKRWELNATYRAAMRTCFHEHLNYRPQQHLHPDLMHSRTKRDNTDVNNLLSTLTTTFINPFSPEPLVSISSRTVAPDNINQDLMVAEEKGKEVMNKFIEERLWYHSTKSFFYPIKKLKLSTFSKTKKIKSYIINNKVVPMQASKDLFSKLANIAQNRSVNLKAVFQYPLGPLPWAL